MLSECEGKGGSEDPRICVGAKTKFLKVGSPESAESAFSWLVSQLVDAIDLLFIFPPDFHSI